MELTRRDSSTMPLSNSCVRMVEQVSSVHDDVAPALDASTGGVQTDPIGGAGDERDAERGHRHRRASMSDARMIRRVSLER